MPAQWQPREMHDWKGLLDRRQRIIDQPEFLSELWNVSMFGGGLAMRGGTVLLTGVTRIVQSASSSVIIVSQAFPFPLALGMTMTIHHQDGGTETFEIGSTAGTDATLIPLAQLSRAPTPGAIVYFQTPLGDDGGTLGSVFPGSPVRGLLCPLYREGKAYIIAVANGRIYEPSRTKLSPSTIAPLAEFPSGVGMPAWAGTHETPWATTAAGGAGGSQVMVTSAEGAEVGGPIRFLTSDGAYQGSVVSITREVTYDTVEISPPYTGALGADVPVAYWGVRDDLETYGVMGGNHQFVTFDQLNVAATGNNRPVKIRDAGSERRVQRMGLAMPRLVLSTLNPPGLGAGIFVDVQVVGAPGGTYGLEEGAYGYRYVWRNALTGQTSEGPVVTDAAGRISFQGYAAVGVAGSAVQLTIRWNTDPQVGFVDIYRTPVVATLGEVPEAGPWYYVGTAENTRGLDIVFVDAIPTLSLGRQMRQFLDNPPPTNLRFLAYWPAAQRMIGVAGNGVVFSDLPDVEAGVFKYESWPTGNTLFLGLDEGDDFVGITAFFDSVLVFKRHSAYRISGAPPVSAGGETSLQIQPVHFRDDRTGLGALSGKLIIQDKNEVIFGSDDGFYQLSRWQGGDQGFSSKRLSAQIDRRIAGIGRLATGSGIPNGVFIREWRQLRAFFPNALQPYAKKYAPTLVFQFEAETEALEGWAQWAFNRLVGPIEPDEIPSVRTTAGPQAPILQSAVYPAGSARNAPTEVYGHAGNDGPENLGPAAVLMADEAGHILQADYGGRDYGGFPYSTIIECSLFAPNGRGRQSRGRAIDFILDVRGALAHLLIEAETELVTSPAQMELEVVGQNEFGLAGWDYLIPAQSELHRRCLISNPGEYHRFRIRSGTTEEAIFNTWPWMMLAATYWFQALSQRTVDRTTAQADLPQVPNL